MGILARPRLRAGFPAHPAHIILSIFLFGSPLTNASLIFSIGWKTDLNYYLLDIFNSRLMSEGKW
jgi:hypothetical protein